MENQVPIKDKFCVTMDKESGYFGIGEKKLRKIVTENLCSDFVIQNGVKYLIKRRRFELFLNEISAI